MADVAELSGGDHSRAWPDAPPRLLTAARSRTAPVAVALVHDYLSERGGAERVAISMTRAFPTAPLYTSVYLPESYPELADVDVRPSLLDRVPFMRANHRIGLPLLPFAMRSLNVDADVVVCSSSGWAHGVHTDAPKIVYCHNPARWLYQRHEYAETRRRYWLASAVFNPPLRLWDQWAARSCDRYLANSSSVADRIKRVYGIDADVVPPPTTFCAEGPQSPIAGIEPGYVIAVSRLLGYKNISAVVDAFARLPGQRLVVVGEGPLRTELEARAGSNVTLTGRVTDEELRWLYANSVGLVSASYEDFGLTPVEAAMFGKPAALLRAGGFLDTMVEGITGVFFDKPETRQIEDAVRTLTSERWSTRAIQKSADRYSERGFAHRLQALADDTARAHH